MINSIPDGLGIPVDRDVMSTGAGQITIEGPCIIAVVDRTDETTISKHFPTRDELLDWVDTIRNRTAWSIQYVAAGKTCTYEPMRQMPRGTYQSYADALREMGVVG